MIRKAEEKDISLIAELYDTVIDYQNANGSYMSWKKGIYPTVETAELGFSLGTLYVHDNGTQIGGSVILDCNQSEEYYSIDWKTKNDPRNALVIHTLCVAPEHMGMGIATEMLTFAKELAASLNCASIRLATNLKNLGAISLYEKNGFSIVAYGRVLLDSKIECPKQCFMEYVI